MSEVNFSQVVQKLTSNMASSSRSSGLSSVSFHSMASHGTNGIYAVDGVIKGGVMYALCNSHVL